MSKIKVLNAGHVELLEWMGGDEAVIRNARLCWRSENRSNERSDKNLIKHLLRQGHMSPFEAMVFTFNVKAPIFIARQWMRHRMSSPMEQSLRYCVAEREYYVPEYLSEDSPRKLERELWIKSNEQQFDAYEELRNFGVTKEEARSVLPLGIYTNYNWTVNGSSLMNFLRLRLDKGAQKEIRDYAETILEIVREVAPVSFKEWEEMIVESK